jgi:hypothetical protein
MEAAFVLGSQYYLKSLYRKPVEVEYLFGTIILESLN